LKGGWCSCSGTFRFTEGNI